MDLFNQLLGKIYPSDAQAIVSELLADVNPNLENFSSAGMNWYKSFNLYVTYGDTFCSNGSCSLETLTAQLEFLHSLGITAIHVLPPFKSPLIDGGFDISDYYTIREDLGGNDAFDELITKVHALKMHVFLDLVCNHVSQEHEWFQKALNGDEYYRKFFIHSLVKPQFIEKYSNQTGIWARYAIDGEEKDIRVIFPDQAGDIPHWIEGKDSCWYYHTFYPHQIDLDWNNPFVFLEFGKILKFWAKKGVNFRLDAIPFVGKDVHRGITESTDKTHLIVQALHHLMKSVSPESTFLVEACQPLEITKKYFGTNNIKESDLAYNFHLMSGLWYALISHDSFHIWRSLKETRDLPSWGQWITFLRNHDDLSLEFPEEEIRMLLFSALEDKGLVCKEGFGIGGQTAEFLDNDPRRLIMAYMLLASLPGCPALIFGDEIGKANDFSFMKNQTQKKREWFNDNSIIDDVRDINRGFTTDEDLTHPHAQGISKSLAEIFKTRIRYKDMATLYPKMEPCKKPSVFSCRYQFETGTNVVVFINLRDDQLYSIQTPA